MAKPLRLEAKRRSHLQYPENRAAYGIGWSSDTSPPSDIPIKRYVKVQSDANPFDPRWRVYFESRKRFR